MDEQAAWQKIWQVIIAEAQMPDIEPQATVDDFDFLQEAATSEQPIVPLPSRLPRTEARAQACAAVLPLVPIAAPRLAQNWQQLLVDDRLAYLDGDGTALLLQLILASAALTAEEQGSLPLLLQRAVLSDDADLAVLAVEVAVQIGLKNVQIQIAQRLCADLRNSGTRA